jgi:hypothetical protein
MSQKFVSRLSYLYGYVYMPIYIYKNVTVRLCVVCSKSQSSESRAPMALQFGYNVAGKYAHVWI